ncbi:hypothetical protein [Proteiniphilum sp.]|uniref:hypothetical protein n=1 Tax=Proteiniphilum sp. TaxID=1926877 RepID=UPI002B21EC71|nr:hypothetical protein [Proteiniphilum sp.]MEA4917634.1 hypothetical protein [Proteiniphilum sp.]
MEKSKTELPRFSQGQKYKKVCIFGPMKDLLFTHSYVRCLSLFILILVSFPKIDSQDLSEKNNTISLPFIELTFDETKGEIAHNSGTAGSRFDAVVG